MALITAGYWQTTYFPASYWPTDYWAEYGVVVTKFLTGIVTIRSEVTGELLSIAKGRTYLTYENGRIVFYLVGCEAMRIEEDGDT